MHTIMNYQKEKLRKKIPFTTASKKENKIPRNKFNHRDKKTCIRKIVRH